MPFLGIYALGNGFALSFLVRNGNLLEHRHQHGVPAQQQGVLLQGEGGKAVTNLLGLVGNLLAQETEEGAKEYGARKPCVASNMVYQCHACTYT